jgi:murein DD-endopeptidase MepM/ murein hydrolase activator NlpD
MSITMDGIGGLIIGHLFKIPQQLLPKGYKYENSIGARLLQIVTTLDHKIENGDWTTTIGAQQVITNEPSGKLMAFNDLLTVNKQGKTVITVPSSANKAPESTPAGLHYPIVGNYIKVGSGGAFNATRNSGKPGAYQHGGVDLAVAVGTPVYAVEDGIATIASDNTSGNYVQISHGQGTTGQLDRYTTYYFHLSSQAVSNGKVTKGQIIGYSGNTGRSDGPHLHFEIRSTGTNIKIDPGTLFFGF